MGFWKIPYALSFDKEDSMIQKIIVVPRMVIKDMILDDSIKIWDNWSLISITTTKDETIVDKDKLKKKGCKDYLECVFSDVTLEEYNRLSKHEDITLFSKECALRIIEFIDRNKDRVDTLVAHCDAGISRSGAVGLFANRFLGLDEKNFRKDNNVLPNVFVLNTLMETSGLNACYQNFWETQLNEGVSKKSDLRSYDAR